MKKNKIIYTEPSFDDRSIFTVLENLALYSFPFVVGIFLFQLILKMNIVEILVIAPTASFISYMLADFICGVVHWVGDTYGDENSPIIGHNLVQPFRWHHVSPKAMTKYSLSTTLGSSVMLALPFMTYCYFKLPRANTSIEYFLLFFIATLCLFSAFANLGHKFAHRKPSEIPSFVRGLQKAKLLLPPEHHNKHHIPPHLTHYCVFNGWCNGFLDRVNFWRKAERFLGILGIHPHPSSKVAMDMVKVVRISDPSHPIHKKKKSSVA